MVELTCDNPLHPAYYYPIIFVYIIIFGLTYIVMYYVKRYYERVRQRALSTSVVEGRDYHDDFINEKNSLKYRYLGAYTLTRAAMWAKAPYLYMLYNKYHGFSVNEIGILYVVDAVSGLISGPIFGSMADKYGRKLFCLNYCVFVFANLGLRLTGSRPLAYIAQILTGFGGGLINSTFESWVVCEAQKVFHDKKLEKERFLKRLFKNINLYDAIISVAISGVAAVIFTYFGVLSAIILSMALSLCAFFVILFLWDENKPNSDKNDSIKGTFREALQELKKRDVLSIGIIESIFQACLNLFIFAWTPLLQRSTTFPEINVGFIFICYVIVMIFCTALYELFIIAIKSRYYLSLTVSLGITTLMWYLVYSVESFFWRMHFLSVINVNKYYF
jgi:MFS family permease